jgi:replication factor A1
MNINELDNLSKNINVSGTIVEKGPPKKFGRMGEPGQVSVAVLEDETGRIDLTLWDLEVDMFEKGDEILIENGKIKEFRGLKQLSSGNSGKITKL